MSGKQNLTPIVAEIARTMLPKGETKNILKDLGLDAAAKKVDAALKMDFAYSKYQFVTEDKITAFQKKLRERTQTRSESGYAEYKTLAFIPLQDYPEIPPADVLRALEAAKKDECFDRFEVARIESRKVDPDPILWGRIDGCSDRFFIAQWDDDVSIEDILAEEQ